MADDRATVGWRDFWIVVRGSAERRIGNPLLVVWLVLALVAVAVVAASMLVTYF